MSDSRLDQIVKGASPPTVKLPAPAPLQNISSVSSTRPEYNLITTSTSDNDNNDNSTNATSPSPQPIDPFSSLPSSPPQIYLNLLILESSLRAQYLQLLSRRRLHTFFVLLLLCWTGTFTYLLFLRPREDGLGLGGSVYWVVETMEKVALMGGAVTIVLFWGTGQWERGIRWPRRWVGTTNRGLRGFNLRVVVMRGPWWKEWPKHLAFLVPTMNLQGSGSDWHLVEYSRRHHGDRHQQLHHNQQQQGGGGLHHSEKSGDEDEPLTGTGSITGLIEEDLAPGGDYIRLLLLPKSFSPEFRENWECYRSDYWEQENERRALLRRKSRSQRRARAKTTGGWMWWLGLWRLRRRNPSHAQINLPASTGTANRRDLERQHSASRTPLSSAAAVGNKRRSSFLRSDSHTNTNTNTSNSSSSRHSSRSSSSRRPSTRRPTITDSNNMSINISNSNSNSNNLSTEIPLTDPSQQPDLHQRTRRGSSSRRKAAKEKDRNSGMISSSSMGRTTLSPLTRANNVNPNDNQDADADADDAAVASRPTSV